MSVIYQLAVIAEADVEAVAKDEGALLDLFSSGEPTSCYLDKAWNGLHWLLAGSNDTNDRPLSRLIMGGTEVGASLPYGRPRFHRVDEVARFSELLSAVTDDELRANYRPEDMDAAEIYPDDWVRDGEEGWEALYFFFCRMRSFFQHAAANRNAVIYAWG